MKNSYYIMSENLKERGYLGDLRIVAGLVLKYFS
jgi:hypothetical protein